LAAVEQALSFRPERQDFQSLRDRITTERDYAARLEQAREAATRHAWERVLDSLAPLPADRAEASALRQQAESELQRLAQLRACEQELAQAWHEQHWDAVVAGAQQALSLGGDALRYKPMLEHAQRRIDEIGQARDFEQRADTSAQRGDWDQAVNALQQAVSLWPENASLPTRLDDYVRERDLATILREAREALDAGDWSHALAATDALPDERPEVAALRQAA